MPRRFVVRCVLAVLGLFAVACAEAPRSNLPPSETDLILLKSTHLCDTKSAFLEGHKSFDLREAAWGAGKELRISPNGSSTGAQESYFFNEDGFLVGAMFVLPNGLNLKPYPVLRRTLSQLKPTVEFYLSGAALAIRANLDSSTLYMTGDEKTTTQYLTQGEVSEAILLSASMSIDPYSVLLSPYRQEFLARIGQNQDEKTAPAIGSKGIESKEPFSSLQQFARGQTAQLAYCGSRDYDRAADAYRKAIAHGFTDKMWIAEAHHRLGLAFEGQGRLDEAKAEMEKSLELRPNIPEVLNNLGTVFLKLGDRDNAMKVLEKAVTLRPNYSIARFNLAEAYEAINAKRAISEYQTYLALVEGVDEEAARAALVRERIKRLR
jgi:tetratricopeptide (TPR) repeat protein